MAFNSWSYLALLLGTVLLRWAAPARARIYILLVASYLFYATWGLVYSLLLAFVSVASFLSGLAMERWPDRRRLIVRLSVSGFVALLGYFKYTGFFAAQLRALGLHVGEPSILLPLGISFYTFVAIAYVIDVSRGEKAERNLPVHLVLVSFFPHLVAGPIVRKREISDQLRQLGRPFDPEQFAMGLFLVVMGLFKKMVLADGLAVHATAVFDSPAAHSSGSVLVGVLAYAGQIFCDFSGYSDVGIGSAKLLGVDFPKNFDQPYLASSPADFWRRWHITLSRWLRDYVWVWVGGSRRQAVFRYGAPIVTMTLGGLWHGAAWTFVAWGLYHGVLLAAHQAWFRATSRVPSFESVRRSTPYRAVAVMVTFTLVVLGWILFRAASFQDAIAVVAQLVRDNGAAGTAQTKTLTLLGLLAIGQFLAAGGWVEALWAGAPGRIRGAIWFALLAAIYYLAAPPAEFIYFQF